VENGRVDDSAQPPRRAGRGGRLVGRVLRIPVYANSSMLLLAALVTVVYGNYVRAQLDLRDPLGYLVGFGFVVCLLGSVLLHELGHALTARRFGIGVRGIWIELLGGWTEMDRDAPNPRVDALVSLAGPAVSLLLGGLATAAAFALPDRTVAGQIAFQLAASNILVAVFNVLPGLPLDGGRALRAGVWAVLKDRDRATQVAGWAGRVIAVATAVVVFTLYRLGTITLFGMFFILLVAFTLWQGAGQSIRLAGMTRRFPLIILRALARPVLTVPSGMPLAEALRQAGEAGGIEDTVEGAVEGAVEGVAASGGGNTVLAVADSAGRIVALVDDAAVAGVKPEQRPWVAVDTVARNVTKLPALPVELTGEQVVDRVQAHPGAQYLVTAGEDVVGVLHVADLAALLEPRGVAARRNAAARKAAAKRAATKTAKTKERS
jgi:Zn-dependent protease